ncbi:biotin transporter BioY [Bengtsoniella intestinalis]
MGVPVFAEFTGGLGILFGSTGGYLIGFLAMTCLYWLVMKNPKLHPVLEGVTLVVGLGLCYGFGTIWFVQVYAANVGEISIATALSWCVIPYIIPDLVKLALAFTLSRRLRRHVSL